MKLSSELQKKTLFRQGPCSFYTSGISDGGIFGQPLKKYMKNDDFRARKLLRFRRIFPLPGVCPEQGDMNILIVEDSLSSRSMIRSVIEDMEGVETVEASTGFEALREIPSRGFSLIITDINMPDVNGLELVNFVKKDPRYRHIPVLIVTSERTDEDRRRGLALGADDYVTKPFDPDVLGEKIRNLLKP